MRTTPEELARLRELAQTKCVDLDELNQAWDALPGLLADLEEARGKLALAAKCIRVGQSATCNGHDAPFEHHHDVNGEPCQLCDWAAGADEVLLSILDGETEGEVGDG